MTFGIETVTDNKLIGSLHGKYNNDLKLLSLSHCIVLAARPRTIILLIQFGVGVSLDHVFGSKWLPNFLARLGLCITNDESNLFKQSVVQCGTDGNLQSSFNAVFDKNKSSYHNQNAFLSNDPNKNLSLI